MILFITSFIYASLLLILSYKQYIVYNNKTTIILIPGMMNFMLGFSFINWLLEDYPEFFIIAILCGVITFLILTSIIISKNNIKSDIEENTFIGKAAIIKDFIVKSHKYYIYIANVDKFVIFVYSKNPLELNSYVTLTNYNNERYFV